LSTATRPLAFAPPSTLTVSVVICTYTTERWADVVRAVESVRAQTRAPEEVILVVDHNDELARLARGAFPGVRVVANAEERGLSGARNTGIRVATGDVIAFLDDDASAGPDWLETMVTHYDDPAVHGVGGSATAVWTGGPRPRWLPAEFDWVVGCTYVGQPTRTEPVRNLVGCNMSFRREVFDLVGGFSSTIGRIGKRPLGCEETELCIRLSQAVPGATLLYDPAVNVEHRVSPDRREFRYFRDRCYSEGLSKAVVTRLVGAGSGLAAERSYVTSVLPRGFLRALLQALLLRPGAAGRAFAIVFGLLATTMGYLRGKLARPDRAPGSPSDDHGRAVGVDRGAGERACDYRPVVAERR
jgi:GT2 family glycosyltransferase